MSGGYYDKKNYTLRLRGFGKQLLASAEQWARDNEIRALRLNSGMKRQGAHKFYRAVGFSDEGEQKRFIKRIDL